MIKKYLSGFILANILLLHSTIVFAEIIVDDVAKKAFEGKVFVKPEYKKEIITDYAENDLKNQNLTKPAFKKVILEDDLIKNNPNLTNAVKPVANYKLIDENAQVIKIPIHSLSYITSKNDVKLGQTVTFETTEDIYKNNKLFIRQKTPVTAYVELITKAGRYGDPDEIELGRFCTKDINNNAVEIDGTIRKQGADRGKWAKPLYYIGISAPFPCAPLMLFYFVKGGKSKIKETEVFKLYYE